MIMLTFYIKKKVFIQLTASVRYVHT